MPAHGKGNGRIFTWLYKEFGLILIKFWASWTFCITFFNLAPKIAAASTASSFKGCHFIPRLPHRLVMDKKLQRATKNVLILKSWFELIFWFWMAKIWAKIFFAPSLLRPYEYSWQIVSGWWVRSFELWTWLVVGSLYSWGSGRMGEIVLAFNLLVHRILVLGSRERLTRSGTNNWLMGGFTVYLIGVVRRSYVDLCTD